MCPIEDPTVTIDSAPTIPAAADIAPSPAIAVSVAPMVVATVAMAPDLLVDVTPPAIPTISVSGVVAVLANAVPATEIQVAITPRPDTYLRAYNPEMQNRSRLLTADYSRLYTPEFTSGASDTAEYELPGMSLQYPELQEMGHIQWRAVGTYTQTGVGPQTIELRVRNRAGTQAVLFSFDSIPAFTGTGRIMLVLDMDILGVLNGTSEQLWTASLTIFEPSAGTLVYDRTYLAQTAIDSYSDQYLAPTVAKTSALGSNVLAMRSFIAAFDGGRDSA